MGKVKITVDENSNVPGSWVDAGNGVTVAAFIQNKVPACTVYQKNQSKMFLVLLDGELQLQFEDKDGEVFWLDAADLQTHVDYKKKDKEKSKKESKKEKE